MLSIILSYTVQKCLGNKLQNLINTFNPCFRLSAGEDYITSAQLIQEIRKVRRALDSSSRHPRGPLYFLTFGCSQNSKDQSIERISSSASKSNGVGGDHVSHPSDEEEKEEVPSEGKHLFLFYCNFCSNLLPLRLRY